MNPDRQQAVNYLRAPGGGLWRWAEDGKVLVWHDGNTIAFREEILHLIEWLTPNGLPPFGAIVFLLAACRGKVPVVADIISTSSAPLPLAMGGDATVLVTARRQLNAQLEETLAELSKLSRLPAELNSGVKAKCFLAEAVFEHAKVERHVNGQTVWRGMNESMSDAELIDMDHPAVTGSYIRQLHLVATGLKPHTAESLALRLRTGLDQLPREADADLPSAERARRLIEVLSRDRDIGFVARAARELMAAVKLPRRLGENDQLALGGVADITNRGPLDRLLLSELAHDDLTLSVRVALNEALYLRREPPMREPPGALALLLDSGVRLWGIPRVLATAVALALIARDKQHSQVFAWRAHGRSLFKVDLLSRNGLTEHLGALEPAAHLGASMPAFCDALRENAQSQAVLITHRDALADPDFRRAVSEHPLAPGFVATVDRDGRFELHALPLAHRSPLCEADLDLAAIFDQPSTDLVVRAQLDPNLPAIFGLAPFPFLLPVAGKVDFWIKGADGYVYAAMSDRRLVRFQNQQSGASVIVDELPGGRIIWMECDGVFVQVLKSGASQRPARLISIPLAGGDMRVFELTSGPEVLAAYRYGEAVVVIRSHDLRVYALSDGRLLGQARNPYQWVNGRFFRSENHFYFAVWDGERVKFELVTMNNMYQASAFTTIFDRADTPGPWMLFRDGQVVSTESGEIIKPPAAPDLRLDFEAVRVSRDGHRLLVPSNRHGVHKNRTLFLLDLDQSGKMEYVRDTGFWLDRCPSLPTWNLYRVIEAIALQGDGLMLVGRKGCRRKLQLVHGKLRIALSPPTSNSLPEGLSVFIESPRKTSHGCTLQSLVFPNGGRVFLDSRGLLHFKGGDSTLPEVSLVLADGEVAGWTSDGRVCGPSFFFDGLRTSDPKHVFDCLNRFFARL